MLNTNEITIARENIMKEIDICWNCFVTSDIDNGINKLQQLFILLDEYIRSITATDELYKVYYADVENLMQVFGYLENAMKAKDYIFVSDILMYEIKKIVEN